MNFRIILFVTDLIPDLVESCCCVSSKVVVGLMPYFEFKVVACVLEVAAAVGSIMNFGLNVRLILVGISSQINQNL